MKKGQWVLFEQLPLLWISISFVIGVGLSSVFNLHLADWIFLSLCLATAALLLRRKLSALYVIGLLCLLAVAVGGARFVSAQPTFEADDLAFYNNKYATAKVTGWLQKPPVYQDDYVELWVQATEFTAPELKDISVDGLMVVRGDLGTKWSYGDVLVVRGELEAPENDEDFPFKDYLARSGAYSVMAFASVEKLGEGRGSVLWNVLYGLRERATQLIYHLYPDPEASLLAGILLGDESGLSDSIKAAFNDTGTRHIIAISGFNISIIAGIFLAIFTRWLGARRGIALAAAGVIAYTILVGAGPSVVRAAIMGLLALLARQLGRDQFGVNTLAVVAAVMVALTPLVLWDIGFQLSFTATLGLMLYSERIRLWFFFRLEKKLPPAWLDRVKAPLSEFVFITLAAQVATLPLLLIYFQRFSLVSLPANFLILPLQPALMILGGLSALLGLLILPLGRLFALATWPLAGLTIRIVEFFASLPFASFQIGQFTWAYAAIYYAALVVMSVPALRDRFTLPRICPAVPAALLSVAVFAIWGRALAAPSGLLELTLLDLPGEAILIRTPAGRSILINGGPSAVNLSQELGRMLPVSQRDLDWIMIAGERPEQINGLLARSENIVYGELAWATYQPSSEMLEFFQSAIASSKEVHVLHAGQAMDLGSDVDLKVLYMGQRGAMLLLTWRQFGALLPLGLDFDQIEAYLGTSRPGEIDLLLLADSGYPALNPPAWLSGIDAPVLWLAGGGVLTNDLQLAAGDTSILEVNKLGWLRATTDGSLLWLSSEHGQ